MIEDLRVFVYSFKTKVILKNDIVIQMLSRVGRIQRSIPQKQIVMRRYKDKEEISKY